MTLNLSVDDALTTTRTVRKRLDLAKPVAREDIEECLEIAFQAPNGSNQNPWHWIVVDDPKLIKGLAHNYNEAVKIISRGAAENATPPDSKIPRYDELMESVGVLMGALERVPAMLVPLIHGRPEQKSIFEQATMWGSIAPAVWSFFLALRERGMGSAWTTVSLVREKEIAELLGIPYDQYTQAGLFPIAYTIGTTFKKAWRKPLSEVVSYNKF